MTATETPSKYDAEYASASIPHFPHFEAEFLHLLALADRSGKRGKILDLGGGTGEHSLVFQALGFDVTLFDFSPIGVERARAAGVRKAICGDFTTHDFGDERFDFVFAKGFSPLATDDPTEYERFERRILDRLEPHQGVFLYWGATDLSGRWSASNWFEFRPSDIYRHFDVALVLPLFRAQCRLPVAFNRAITRRLLALGRPLPRTCNLVGVRFAR
jgi:SAM-dependent methyltransferase